MAKVNLGNRLVPSLFVHDMQQTLAFYKKLGFQLSGCHPNESTPAWAEVIRDAIVFQFYTALPCDVDESPACLATYYIYPDSVAALADEFRDKVEFAWGPDLMDYGMFEFAVRDPNGYYIAFAEPAN